MSSFVLGKRVLGGKHVDVHLKRKQVRLAEEG